MGLRARAPTPSQGRDSDISVGVAAAAIGSRSIARVGHTLGTDHLRVTGHGCLSLSQLLQVAPPAGACGSAGRGPAGAASRPIWRASLGDAGLSVSLETRSATGRRARGRALDHTRVMESRLSSRLARPGPGFAQSLAQALARVYVVALELEPSGCGFERTLRFGALAVWRGHPQAPGTLRVRFGPGQRSEPVLFPPRSESGPGPGSHSES